MTTDGADRFLPDEVPEDPDAVDTPWQAPEGASHQQLYTSDPSVFAEPWMQPLTHRDDPSDAGCSSIPTEASEDHSVWDEPGLSRALSGETPSDALTWFRWYRQRSQDTSVSMTWLVTVAVAAVAGLFAIVGTILVQSVGGTALMTISVIGPTTEEIMKIALPLWLVERRPWLYRSGAQILLCAFMSGIVFAAVENVIYLEVYIPNALASVVTWRWSICVVLHAGCSTIAGWGAVQIWRQFQVRQRPPAISDGAVWIIAAIFVHGIYNTSVTLMALGGLDF